LKTRLILLLISILVATSMSLNLISSSEVIVYIVINPSGETSLIAADPCNTTYFDISSVKIRILYSDDPTQLVLNIDGQPVNYSILKIENSELNIEVNIDEQGQHLSRFNVKHVYLETRHLVIEIYYDVESKILLFSYILNKLSNEEYEVLIKRIPSNYALTCMSETSINVVNEASRDNVTNTTLFNKEINKENNIDYTILLYTILLVSISIIVFTLWGRIVLKHVFQKT